MRATYGKPCFSALQKCCYSTQTGSKAAEKVRFTKEAAKVTRLSNGVNIASVETLSPVVHLAYVFNAGSRYETTDNLGITHCIRRAASLANKKYSNFGIVRNLQQIGATLTCITTRDLAVYAVDCLRSELPLALDILGNAALLPEFKPWEISDNTEYIKRDLLALEQDPESQVIDLLHKAAYRTTLGNPIYMPSHRVGHHSPQQLKQFTDAHYGASNLSIVVLGADHDSVMMINRRGELVLPAIPASTPTQPEKAKYRGGELRQENANELVHVAVASESVPLNAPDMPAVQVLEHIMGSCVHVKYSSGASKFAKAISAATKAPFMVRCLNYSYSDSGLFGFHLVTGKNEIGKALKAAAGAFSAAVKGGITEEDVKHAKARVKAEVHFAKESVPTHALWLGRQLGITGQVTSPEMVDTIVDKVSLQDVQNVAKKIIQSKASLAAVGDLRNTPHLDELRS